MPLSSHIDDVLLTAPEAARFLRMSRHTLAWWRSHGRGPRYLKIGTVGAPGSVRYRLGDLKSFLNEVTPAVPMRLEAPHVHAH